MPVPDLTVVSARPVLSRGGEFTELGWRGEMDEVHDERALRPLVALRGQADRLSGWITGGLGYGWLGAYAGRRSSFELRSIVAQIDQATAGGAEGLPERARRVVQSRLDRLEACLEAQRTLDA
jgi:hypothetical protein